ncbi:MAG TPA: AAA family ATPase [Anaerolineae bacterium]|nr:AAA family ATPase [Anaerolineae bacterium]
MSNLPRELTADQLRRACAPADLSFQSTDELEQLNEIIGQDRATRAIEFGLDIPSYGYNIYALGPAGAGKTTTIAKYLERKAAERPVPNDWGYVNNFVRPDEPLALRLPPGGGRQLRDRFDTLLTVLEEQLPKAFESENYEQHRKEMVQELEQRRQQVLEDMETFARERGFAIVQMPMGLLFAPLIDGKAATPEQFEQLPVEQQKTFKAQEPELRTEMERSLRELKTLSDEAASRLQNLDREIAAATVGPGFDELQADYSAWDEVVEYLAAVREHISQNVEQYKSGAGDGEEQPDPAALLLGPPESLFEHYRINVVVDHGGETGAPVVVETNPTYYNLIGRIEQEAQFGTLVTDYSLIKGGSLLRANGGYLVVDARALLRQPLAYEALKRSLRHQQVKIEELGAQFSLIATTSLSLEPIPLDVKVILIGDPYTYYLLYAYDDEFQKLFKVRADFASQMDWTAENMVKVARFIRTRCAEENLPPFDPSGVAKVIEYSGRLVEDQRKLTTRFAHVTDIVREAAYWARTAAKGQPAEPLFVTGQDVQRAIDERRYRSSLVEERVREAIVNGTVMIDVAGATVGQVNGLAVLALGDTMFGKPSRITAKTFLGQSGVINIEREAKLSGKVHDKGMLIISGYLGGKYAQDKPLSLTATITFEQSYDGIDGDSASSTEVYALLSALARLPIQQGIAVTGSVNQHGEIQAIGGATAKIEGFFDVCKEKGLTGQQGVILPATNGPTLMLREDVVEAVAAGQFHIYPVTTIDEGIAILTGLPAGERGPDGRFPQDTVNRRVDDALRELGVRFRNFGKPPAKKDGTGKPGDEENGNGNDEPVVPHEPELPGDEPDGAGDEPGLPGDEPDNPDDEPGLPSDEPEPLPGPDWPIDDAG